MSLYPVSHRSTRGAVNEVIGKGDFEVANAAVCDKYAEKINREQPVLWPGFERTSNFYLNIAKLARIRDGFSGMGYLSGALIFFAATEGQAAFSKKQIRQLSPANFEAWHHTLIRDNISKEDRQNLVVVAHNITPRDDIEKLKASSLQDFDTVHKEVLADNMASYSNHPFMAEYLEQGKKTAVALWDAANSDIAQFLTDEPHFSEYMQHSWDMYPPRIAVAQRLGAANMRGFLLSAGIE